jgi:nucleoside-diphosphate-sugar epimerase
VPGAAGLANGTVVPDGSLADARILITGASGVVGTTAALKLAASNEVWALGRWSDAAVLERFRASGIRTVHWDISRSLNLDAVPRDVDYVMHAAPFRGLKDATSEAIRINAGSVGALMSHCAGNLKAFLYVSTVLVYARLEYGRRHAETDQLGGYAPWNPSYPLGKLAAEAAVQSFAETLGVPSVVARMNTAYGPGGRGGLPVRIVQAVATGKPLVVGRGVDHLYNPIHADDVARQVPLLWRIADVPTVIVNWGGDDMVAESQLIRYAAELTGRQPVIEEREIPIHGGLAYDNAYRSQLIGSCEWTWREGLAAVVDEHYRPL